MTIFGSTLDHNQIELVLAFIGSLFGLFLLWGVVTRNGRMIIVSLVVIAVTFLWWYGMSNGWLDGRLGPMG